MELHAARQIIDTLAQGVHPVTGEVMPEDSPYNAPPVIRALFTVSQALEEGLLKVPKPAPVPVPVRVRAAPPVNAGKPWSSEDDAQLQAAFDEGTDLKALADKLGRTRFGIEQRLIKLGKMAAPAGGGRYGGAA
ncbi:MAG TPA: hypothetical protein VHA82_03050 [Ramlibacter sp.]|uniref:hypothetical protein n=1 Tax=Ramlibacter sp. TaxID=1917967 RepID=UPI002B675BBA|nr:hypothetical protein [Ramlibacter sp.]HVZ42763.1 hypothetical protein [Ramlibacter sp.]